jgi:hypothetical protein
MKQSAKNIKDEIAQYSFQSKSINKNFYNDGSLNIPQLFNQTDNIWRTTFELPIISIVNQARAFKIMTQSISHYSLYLPQGSVETFKNFSEVITFLKENIDLIKADRVAELIADYIDDYNGELPSIDSAKAMCSFFYRSDLPFIHKSELSLSEEGFFTLHIQKESDKHLTLRFTNYHRIEYLIVTPSECDGLKDTITGFSSLNKLLDIIKVSKIYKVL